MKYYYNGTGKSDAYKENIPHISSAINKGDAILINRATNEIKIIKDNM